MKLERNLGFDLQRATEAAALRSARWMGRGDKIAADQAAVDGLRTALATIEMDGVVVIGEGEKDEAPMLYIGEQIGNGNEPKVDIAVDPLEGTNLCATGAPNAIAVLAASDEGGLLHAPDLYMEKLVVGPSSKHAVSLDAPVAANLRAIARCLERDVEDLVVVFPCGRRTTLYMA